MSRLSSGNPQIDEILGGGFLANSINIVMGEPGSGKAVFMEQLAFHNAGGGRPILYLSTLSEPLAKVVTYLQRFRFFDPDKLGTDIVYDDVGAAAAREGLPALMRRIDQAIKRESPKIIIVDSFKALADRVQDLAEWRRILFSLAGLLSAYDTTTFFVGEYGGERTAEKPDFAVADGIVQRMRRAEGARDERFLRVLKLRGSSYREGQHAFRISDRGLEAYPRLVPSPMRSSKSGFPPGFPAWTPSSAEASGAGAPCC